jgi:hypothetical protein
LKEIEINNIEKLYQVWCDKLKLYVSPIMYYKIYGDSINISNFISNESYIFCYLDINYVFLDSNYRANSLRDEGIVKYVVDYVKKQTETLLSIGRTYIKEKYPSHGMMVLIEDRFGRM